MKTVTLPERVTAPAPAPEHLDSPHYEEADSPLQWWGYRHIHGSVHAKRYLGHRDIIEAMDSDFVSEVVEPFQASSREDALRIVAERTKPAFEALAVEQTEEGAL